MGFNDREKDDFWDVDKLIPRKKPNLSSFSTTEKTVLVTVSGEETQRSAETKLTAPERSAEEGGELSYSYATGLLRSVKIKRFVDKYDFYGNFRKAALVYYDYKTSKCEFAPFFSYMPQYSQLNTQQKNFYFYFRDCVRRGKFIDTDYSYFYLYVYEILNLPDKISAEDGLKLLVRLWREYRERMPNIDANMSLWIQDYCLVYNLRCPMEDIRDFIFAVIGAAEFKEFYLSEVSSMGLDGIGAMIAYLSDYDWRRGKYAGGENKEAYAKHLMGAMAALINELSRRGMLIGENSESAVISRSAFKNSLCTHSVKCRLEIEYIPLSKSVELRKAFTGALKYTENKLRALLGVKSRLAIKDLPGEYKNIIDRYFVSLFDKANKEKARASMPEYEKMYDGDHTALSIEGAEEIERSSWSTTVRLVADGEDEIEFVEAESAENGASSIEAPEREEAPEVDTYGLSSDEILFIGAVYSGDMEKMKKSAELAGMLPDALVDRINEAFADGFGDVILEGEDGEYNIISDYLEDVSEWLRKLTK